MLNDKPKFFVKHLPQNKPELNHTVEPPLVTFEMPKCSFRSRFGGENSFDPAGVNFGPDQAFGNAPDHTPIRRYDRRVFVKVDESRTQDEWEQYGICHGFTDNKFLPGILRGFDDPVGVENVEAPPPQPKPTLSEPISPVKSSLIKPATYVSTQAVQQATNVNIGNSSTVKVQNNDENVEVDHGVNNAMENDDIDALFFKYLWMEFSRLDCSRKQNFKRSVVKALFSL